MFSLCFSGSVCESVDRLRENHRICVYSLLFCYAASGWTSSEGRLRGVSCDTALLIGKELLELQSLPLLQVLWSSHSYLLLFSASALASRIDRAMASSAALSVATSAACFCICSSSCASCASIWNPLQLAFALRLLVGFN